jgi:hypothetical protein
MFVLRAALCVAPADEHSLSGARNRPVTGRPRPASARNFTKERLRAAKALRDSPESRRYEDPVIAARARSLVSRGRRHSYVRRTRAAVRRCWRALSLRYVENAKTAPASFAKYTPLGTTAGEA